MWSNPKEERVPVTLGEIRLREPYLNENSLRPAGICCAICPPRGCQASINNYFEVPVSEFEGGLNPNPKPEQYARKALSKNVIRKASLIEPSNNNFMNSRCILQTKDDSHDRVKVPKI